MVLSNILMSREYVFFSKNPFLKIVDGRRENTRSGGQSERGING